MDSPARPRRRTLVVTLTATVLAAAAFVVAMRFAPDEQQPNAAAQNAPIAGEQPPPSMQPAPKPPAPEQPGPQFESWVGEVAGWLDIPQRAMHAYASATVAMDKENPDCGLSWVTLAGLGKITTNHGRVNGGELGEDGTPGEPIGTLQMRDFSGKVISAKGAAGPLQLPPAVWSKWQRAADGEPDVQNIDDAALTAGRALCAGGRDLSTGQGWLDAVSSLQDAPLFLHRVLATANLYGTVGENEHPPNPAALQAVGFAIEKIGLPYIWGGNGKEHGDPGFDCSGLTTAGYATAGIRIPRTAHTQYHATQRVAEADLRPGDLVFYGDPGTKVHHVGMYIGNQQMIDAPTFGQAVQVHNYRKPNDDYAGAGRPTT